jgi:peptidoglycan hydrolase-like protein with peptidoglycan-binding domain
MPLTISAAVGEANAAGQAAPNNADDVFVVQGLLNNVPAASGGASPRLEFDGHIGPATRAAIRNFQQTALGFQDGRVDVGGRTIRSLNELAGVRCVRVDIKILHNPTVPVNTMIRTMRRVYAQAAIGVELTSTEELALPELDPLDVGECIRGVTTPDQDALFANQNCVNVNEQVAYIVRATDPPANGCAAHPTAPVARPGAVLTRVASQFTLGHELGHVMGLSHLDTEGDDCATADFGRLMTGCGTSNIVGTPLLDETEIATLRASSLLFACC